MKPCPDCDGTGIEQIPCGPGDTACEFCHGTGEHAPRVDVASAVRDAAAEVVRRFGGFSEADEDQNAAYQGHVQEERQR